MRLHPICPHYFLAIRSKDSAFFRHAMQCSHPPRIPHTSPRTISQTSHVDLRPAPDPPENPGQHRSQALESSHLDCNVYPWRWILRRSSDSQVLQQSIGKALSTWQPGSQHHPQTIQIMQGTKGGQSTFCQAFPAGLFSTTNSHKHWSSASPHVRHM